VQWQKRPNTCIINKPMRHNVRFTTLKQLIRLPSNLRPTTRECVHLVTRGHFRSRNKDGDHSHHTIRSAIP